VHANVELLTQFKESPVCRQIGLERCLFVGKLGLCNPQKIVLRFAPALKITVEDAAGKWKNYVAQKVDCC